MLSWLHYPTCFSAQTFLLPFHSVLVLTYCKYVHNPCPKTPQHLLPLISPHIPDHFLSHICFIRSVLPFLNPFPCSIHALSAPPAGCTGLSGSKHAASGPISSQSVETLGWPLPALCSGCSHGLLSGSATLRCAPLPSNIPVSPQDECQ